MALNKYIVSSRSQASKMIQHTYIQKMMTDAGLLFLYAIRQLRGKDYVKRVADLCEEIEAQAYLVAQLEHGWDGKVAANINVMTEDIVSQSEAYYHSQNHQPVEAR